MEYYRSHAWGNFAVDGLLALFGVLASLVFGFWQMWGWFILAVGLTVVLLTGLYVSWLDLARDPDPAQGDARRVPGWRLVHDLVPVALMSAYLVGTLRAAEYGWAILCGIILSAGICTLLAGVASNRAERSVR